MQKNEGNNKEITPAKGVVSINNDDAQDSYYLMSWEFIQVALPSMMCTIILFSQHLCNMAIAGHLGDTSLIASIGMGNMIQNVLFVSPILGINGALETLASQAAGAGNKELAGIYHNRGRIVLFGLLAIQCLICTQTKKILMFMGQNEKVSAQTHEYMISYMPALVFYGLNDLQRKLLNSFKKNMLPLASFMVSVAMHPLWCKWLAIDLDMKLRGIALAGTISNLFNYIVMTTFFWLLDDMQEAFVWPDKRSFQGLKSYLSIGLPSACMGGIDDWSIELMTVISGLIGV